ncbi:MAG: peptidyl-alpha-hydroxyglycine alpha-amidating lyase family protein [Chloroflexota bacterium]
MTRTVGSGKWTFEPVADWGRSAARPQLGLVSGVACGPDDTVYVFQREPQAMMLVFDRDGTLLRTWGLGDFRHPHGVWIGPVGGSNVSASPGQSGQDPVVLLTDRDLHQVLRYSLAGERLAAWGTAGQPGAPGQPFNEPARATATAAGDIFVADGYGQHRVHRFTADGQLIRSWGQEGTGPGEFGWPVHDVCLDPRGRLLVADRGNNRIQHFTPDGEYLGEWPGLQTPQAVCITPDQEVFIAEGAGAITVMNLDGDVLCRWGEKGDQPGQFAASPHSLWLDSRGDLYVGEVTTPDRFQKFIRR